MPSPIRPVSIGLSLGLLLACGSTDTATTTPDSVTLIAIDPTHFPVIPRSSDGTDAPQCNQGLGTYVAELIDASDRVSQDATQTMGDFLVQASPATSCGRTVAFGEVVANREYRARIRTYSDDVCTIGRTSVTVTKVDGVCPNTLAEATVLAQPSSTILCYGWRANGIATTGSNLGTAGSAGAPSDTGASGSAGMAGAGTASSTTTGPGNLAGCNPQNAGCPAAAVDYRTVTLPYCVLSSD